MISGKRLKRMSASRRHAMLVAMGEARNHCDTCPHVDYLTVSVERHEHECSSCGATFVDAAREKRYFGRAPR